MLLSALSTALLSSLAASGPSAQSAPPGNGAVVRSDPKITEVRLEVDLYSIVPTNVVDDARIVGQSFHFRQVEVGVPVLLRTSWCDTDFDKLAAQAWVDGFELRFDRAKFFERPAAGQQAILRYTLDTGRNDFAQLRTQATYLVQRWDVSVDERAAAAVTWPREWPTETQAFLGREFGINPEDEAIKSLASGASPGGPRAVTPFFAARNSVVAVLARWKSLTGSTGERNPDRSLRGFAFSTGTWGLAAGKGSAVELCATCVAAIRSTGIPSRMVHGLRTEAGGNDKSRVEFHTICEFFLPDTGWVPFDPLEMRSNGAATKSGSAPIKGFANVTDLRKVLPLAYTMVPEGYQKADRYALWGARFGQGSVDSDGATSRVLLSETSRGNGKVKSMPAPVN